MSTLKLLSLSSTCVDNERENVLTNMGYANGFFSFSRTPDGSIPNRFYPTLEEAYRTTLEKFRELGQFKNSKNNFFSISDSAKSIVYKGIVSSSGKIKFSIYESFAINKTSTINEELNYLKNNKINIMEKNDNLITAGTIVPCTESEINEMAQVLLRNAQPYLDNNILSQSSLDFLCLPEDSVKNLAQLIQETAVDNKSADNQTFISAINDVSNGMLTITKTLATGKAIADTHVSFHDDSLYCAVHCKSTKALFDGSNTWRKVPGKIANSKVGEAVIDMYHKGQQLLLSSTGTTTSTTTSDQANTVNSKLSLNDVSANIASTVILYLNRDSYIQRYLNIKGCTLTTDLANISNGVITGAITNNNITLSVPSGHSCIISTNCYANTEQLHTAIIANVAQLFVSASISNITRDQVSSIIELSTIEDYYINSTKLLLSPAA